MRNINIVKRFLSITLSLCIVSAGIFTGGFTSKAVTAATPIAIAAGGDHSIALMNDGTVWAWGDNQYGQLGNGTNNDSSTPVQVPGLTGITAIAAGYRHSMALGSNGRVYAWGDNQYGQLGDGTYVSSNTPVTAIVLPSCTKIAAGFFHSMAIGRGMVFAWGSNSDKQLGIPSITASSCNAPNRVGSFTTAIGIAGGSNHSLAVLSTGTVWAWGDNQYGQLGDGTNTDRNAPVQVQTITNATKVSAGALFSLAVSNSNGGWSWGHNGGYELGDYGLGFTGQRNSPGGIALPNIISLSAGNGHALAINTSNQVYGWGGNYYGQLGIRPYLGWFDDPTIYGEYGRELESAVPLTISVTNATAIAGGSGFSLILKNDGTVWALGNNANGQLGNGSTTNSNVPVQVLF